MFVFAVSACGENTVVNETQRDEAQSSIEQEFRAYAESLTNSSNRYFGVQQVADLQSRLESNPLTPEAQRAKWTIELCFHHLRLGKIDEAKAAMERVMQGASKLEPGLRRTLLRVRAIISLREAEVENCVKNHQAQCCIFPLEGGGVHRSNSEPARRAKADLLAILGERPEDLLSQWLLNIVSMALGEYPDQVPEAFRLPEASLESEHDIGRFVDVAPELGVDAFNLCGGVIVEDFDGDGFLDIVTSTSDPNASLTYYRNTGDGSFADVTAGSGLEHQLGGLNCIGADYDNDGDTDVLVLRGAWMEDEGRIRNSLLRNDGPDAEGRARFADVSQETGMADRRRPTQTAAWLDFDNDGDLDLYVGNESRMGSRSRDGNYPCELHRNNGDGTFSDVATEAGVTNDRFTKGVTVGDYDNDGDMDIYVSNVGFNRLYQNQGDGTFRDVAEAAGVPGGQGHSFAPWFFDFDNDGDLDLFVASYQSALPDFLKAARGQPHAGKAPYLYRNNGDGTFIDIAKSVGLDRPMLPMGANVGDLDNDGWLDFYLATGQPAYETLVPNVMLRNDAGVRFQDVTTSAGAGHLQKGHGVAFADFDHDGDQDIYNQLGGFYPGDKFNNALFLNPGHGNRHVVLQLEGTKSNRNAIGARIEVVVSSGGEKRSLHRAVGSVSSFGGSPMRRIEVGLGAAEKIEAVKIQWPSGAEATVEGVTLDTMVRVVEGEAGFALVERKVLKLGRGW